MTSVYFNNQNATSEQFLLEDMILESIKNHGISVYYIPRDSQSSTDELFGDDPVKCFSKAFKIDMYIESTKEYTGNHEFFSKFGLEIQDSATVVMARRTFEKVVWKNTTAQLDKNIPERHVPKEGDLVYLPVQYKLMEIKFVEQEKNFFQLGRDSTNPYMYSLSLEAFKYNGELFTTGVEIIDRIGDVQGFSLEHILNTGGIGTYQKYEWVYQGDSLDTATARGVVASWNRPDRKLKLRNIKGDFAVGVDIKGYSSGAVWTLPESITITNANTENLDDNTRLEIEAGNFLDFTEHNPFGEVN